MSYKINPKFSVTRNRLTGKTYLTNERGEDAVINDDAFRLLNLEIPGWHLNADYRDFFDACLKNEWLVSESHPGQAIIREANLRYHLKRVQIESLLQCNLSCEHCYCSSSPTAPKGLSTDEFKNLLLQLSEMGVLIVDLTGGEPLMRRDLFELIAYSRSLGMAVSLFSNGTLINPEIARKLKSLGVFRVQISLDARTPEIHDRIRGKKGAFERASRGAIFLHDAGVPCSVNVMVNRLNVGEIRSLVDYIEVDLKANYTLDRIIPAGRAVDSTEIALSNVEYYEAIRREFPAMTPVTSKVCDTGSKTADNKDPHCGVAATYCFIKHDGTVILCPTMTVKENPDFATAKFQDSSVADIWLNHTTFKKFRGIQCENISVCPSGPKCRGGCRSNAYLLHQSLNSPDEMSCNLEKNSGSAYVPFLELYKKNLPSLDETK